MKRTNLMKRLDCSNFSPRRWSQALALAAVLAIAWVSAAHALPLSGESGLKGDGAVQPVRLAQAKAAMAKPGGILRIGGERDVNDLDPHTTRVGWDINIMQNVYSGLVKAGTDIQPRPDLATSWDFKTTTRLEFTLRQGVKFHNGREFTSADAKYSLQRILDPNVPAGYASTIASIDTIETPSKYKLVLNLKRPDAAIVTNLSLPAMAMVAKEAVKPMPVGLKDGMMGTGPYMFKEQIKGRRLVLVKNPNYYDKSVPLWTSSTSFPSSIRPHAATRCVPGRWTTSSRCRPRTSTRSSATPRSMSPGGRTSASSTSPSTSARSP